MTATTLITTALLTLAPISELRGGIPFAIARDVPIGLALVGCVVLNAAVGPLVFLFLGTIHRFLNRYARYEAIVGRLIERARAKVERNVARYGYLGLALFVAIPLPITGAYTGSIGAWVLGLDPKKSYLAVLGGVVVAGIIVTIITLLGIEALSIFVKEVSP